MPQEFDSQVLQTVSKTLQLSGAPSQRLTFFDGELQQVLDVTKFVRRGASPQIREGIYTGIIANVHAGASGVVNSIDPYNAGADSQPPWPAVIGPEFDVWLLGAQGLLGSGAATLDDGFVAILAPATAIGIDTQQTFATPLFQVLKIYSTIAQFTSSGLDMMADGAAEQRLDYRFTPVRIPRGWSITFSTTSLGVSTYLMSLHLALMPAGLGQDGYGDG